ncbi:MAG: hypothetical protein HRU41_01145 [Saprospiraceae bacterium]|nr:hypothetical protein [Saprospiraceae bacterium]
MSEKRKVGGRIRQVWSNTLQRVNWTYALGEVFLIFIGISLAISFSNWNERRAAKVVEMETLKELKGGLEKDLADIKVNIQGHSSRLWGYKWLLENIESGNAEQDSLEKVIPIFIGTTVFVTNTAPYEMLKSRGLEIISNDSIRLQLLTYYDITQEWIVDNEQRHIEHHRDYIKPFLLKYMQYRAGKYVVDEPSVLLGDESVAPILQWARINDNYILTLYKNAQSDVEKLIILLQQEINHLR